MNNFSEKANFIWSVADLIRDTFKRGHQDVILPFTALRRLDCVLAPTKEPVFEARRQYASRLQEDVLADLLKTKAGFGAGKRLLKRSLMYGRGKHHASYVLRKSL